MLAIIITLKEILGFCNKKCYTKIENKMAEERMKTLYEILEVSESASKEIIEKAYKVLAKKYHPDLQIAENKPEAEKKMKKINEAYSILSDEETRKEYDKKLELERQEAKLKEEKNTQQTYQNQGQAYYGAQNQAYNNEQNQMNEAEYQEAKKQMEEAIKNQQRMQQEIQKNMQAQYEQKYQDAYENYLRSLGYKIKHKWTWKNYKDFFITILIIVAICLILWFFPPTHKWIMDFYNSNDIVKTIIEVIGGILSGIWDAICSLFSGEKIL